MAARDEVGVDDEGGGGFGAAVVSVTAIIFEYRGRSEDSPFVPESSLRGRLHGAKGA